MSDILPEFTTKRFIFNALEKNALNKPGCYCVIGAKKIGKTVLLKQLRQHNETNTVYIDASTLGYETNFKDLYKSLEEKGIKNILIDDINKLNEDLIADFNSDTISYANKMCFILSGSICASVRKFCRDICMGGWEYELPPIMYIERLCWKKGLNKVSAEAVKKLSSYDLYLSYLKMQNTVSDKQGLDNITDIVADTLESYLRCTALGDSQIDMSVIDIYEIIKYFSMCQYVHQVGNDEKANFDSIPGLPKNIRESLEYAYDKEKKRWELSGIEKDYVLCLLYGSCLVKGIWQQKGLNLQLDCNCVNAFVFEYPWLSSLFLSTRVNNTRSLIAMWIENSVLAHESYIYPYSDKYKDIGSHEIDKVIASMELEYMDLVEKEELESCLSVDQLIEKYFG